VLHELKFLKHFLSTLVLLIQMPVILNTSFTHSNASNSSIPGTYALLRVRNTHNQTDSEVASSRSCEQGKITKKD